MNTNWSIPAKYIAGVGLVLLAIFILYLGRSVIPLLVVAALIAVVVRPVILWLHRRFQLPRSLAVGLVYLGLAIVAPLIIILSLPTIVDALEYIGNLDYESILQSLAEGLRSTLIEIQAARLPVAGIDAYIDRAVDMLLEAYQPFSPAAAPSPSLDAVLQQLSSTLMSVVGAGANLVGEMFSQAAKMAFIFLASIYISLDAHAYRDEFLKGVPAAYRPEISSLMARIERVWNAFFHGELILMLVIGVITTIGLTVLGVPGALYLGIIAGLLEIIPNLGPLIATVPAVIVALVQGSTYLPVSHLAFAGVVILFYILVQQVENNLIVPRVLGDTLELPPLIVMTGILVGVSAGGILGALLSTPVIATGREVLKYIHCKIWDQEPLQTGSTVPKSDAPASWNRILSPLVALQRRIRSRLLKSRQGNGEK